MCKHSFSRSAILDYLKNGPMVCPITGCSKELSVAAMYEDASLKTRVAAYVRRQKEDGGRSGKAATQYMAVSDSEEDD